MSNNKSHQRCCGFTLVEVMVAVVVVAVSVSAVLFQMMGALDNTGYLRDKTIAQWVALNQLELAYLENAKSNRLPEREQRGSETMVGREWFWRMKPLESNLENYRQLEVSVSLEEQGDNSLVTVIGLVDQFHAP